MNTATIAPAVDIKTIATVKNESHNSYGVGRNRRYEHHLVVEAEGRSLVINTKGTYTREGKKTTRVYAACPEERVLEIAKMDAHPAYSQQCQAKELPSHVASMCPSCINDAAWKVYNRAEIKVMREGAEAILAELGITGVTLKWSKYAGCSCPCSSGFIASKAITVMVEGKGRMRIEQIG